MGDPTAIDTDRRRRQSVQGSSTMRQVVHGREREQEAVEAVEHAAVALDDRTEVLDVEIALEHALDEVADRRHDRDHDAPAANRCSCDFQVSLHSPIPTTTIATIVSSASADQTLDGLVGADPRPQRRAAGGGADEQRTDVVGDHAEGDQEQRVGAPIVAPGSRCRSSSRSAGSAPRTNRASRSRRCRAS